MVVQKKSIYKYSPPPQKKSGLGVKNTRSRTSPFAVLRTPRPSFKSNPRDYTIPVVTVGSFIQKGGAGEVRGKVIIINKKGSPWYTNLTYLQVHVGG